MHGFFLSSLVAGVEFGEDKVTKMHISHVWKASSMNLTRKQIIDQFKKEIHDVQTSHKVHAKKRNYLEVKKDWQQTSKKVCRGLSSPYEDVAKAAAGGA